MNRRRRGVVVGVLLLLSLGLAALLAFQAQVSAAYHRSSAEGVLHDYAAFAAARFASRAAQELYYYAFNPALAALERARSTSRGGALPPPELLPTGDDTSAHRFLMNSRYDFVLEVKTGQMRIGGTPPSAREAAWLKDTLAAHSRAVYQKDWYFAALIGGPDPDLAGRLYFYRIARDSNGAPGKILGLEADPQAMQPFFEWVASSAPLLPKSLTRGVEYDSVGSVIVHDARGETLYRTLQQYEPGYTGRDSLGAFFAGMQVRVDLRADAAGNLVFGGLPKTRLPVLIGVLLLTAALIGAALLLLRREYELSGVRADFVSGVSHELRTPLAQIRMFSETLLLGRVRSEEERTRSIAIIDQESRRLTHMVENLLHFSRAERQVTKVALEPTDLCVVAREVIEGFTPLAAARNVTLCPSIADCVVVPADAGALRQMLLNLLDNAVKYGPAGQQVTLGVAPVNGGGGARLWVDDQGPGIPDADRARVWERFWRLGRDRGSPIAGTGIGLAVVRELAELHGGRTWVEEAPGGGARFVIELPGNGGSGSNVETSA